MVTNTSRMQHLTTVNFATGGATKIDFALLIVPLAELRTLPPGYFSIRHTFLIAISSIIVILLYVRLYTIRYLLLVCFRWLFVEASANHLCVMLRRYPSALSLSPSSIIDCNCSCTKSFSSIARFNECSFDCLRLFNVAIKLVSWFLWTVANFIWRKTEDARKLNYS